MSIFNSLFSLEDRVVIITGGAGLLGSMHARAILESGGIPVLIDIDNNRTKTIIENLKSEYRDSAIESACCSVVDRSGLEKIKEYLIGKYGDIYGLINNACNNPTMKDSYSGAGRFEDTTYESWLRDTEVGLYGSINCCQVFGKSMANNNGGVILNISSDLGIIAPNQALYKREELSDEEQPKKPVSYSTVKWGLIGLTKYLSTYWADKNVRVNALALGGVLNGQDQRLINNIIQQIPMGRMANKDEYMGSIIYMLSDASTYMNGAVVVVDGGRTSW